MTIIGKVPCLLTLSTHGGAVIDVGFAEIVSCFGGLAFLLKTDPAQRLGLYPNIAGAYIATLTEFNKMFTPPPKKEQNGQVDQWL